MNVRSAAARADASSPNRGRAALLADLDAAPGDATVEIDGHAVALTHLDRVYWPARADLRQAPITKRDLLRYLVEVAPLMLPHLRDRPLTLFRWPEGIVGRRVLEKHWEMTLPPFVERVDIFSDAKGHRDQYILCNNLATLVWLAHMGTLEFHAWHSRTRTGGDAPGAGDDFETSTEALEASVLERPDYVLFDLDPFIYSGREAKGREPSFNRPAFAKALSPRGLSGAPVSMPLSRRRLRDAHPLDFRITTVPALLKKRGDAWSGWLAHAQGVEDVLARDLDAPGRAPRGSASR